MVGDWRSIPNTQEAMGTPPTPLSSDEVYTGWRGQSRIWGGGCTSLAQQTGAGKTRGHGQAPWQ